MGGTGSILIAPQPGGQPLDPSVIHLHTPLAGGTELRVRERNARLFTAPDDIDSIEQNSTIKSKGLQPQNVLETLNISTAAVLERTVVQSGINVTKKTDMPIHDWYRFVLSYPPHLVRQYIERFGLHKRDLLCDPFCGTGTTLVEAKKCGIGSVGWDAHPFAVLVSRTKTNWSLDADLLRSLLQRIVAGAEKQMIQHNLPPLSFYATMVKEPETQQRNGYRLSEDAEKLLPTGF